MDQSPFTDASFAQGGTPDATPTPFMDAQHPSVAPPSASPFTDSAFMQQENPVVAKAQTEIGKTDDIGWCQRWVEKIKGIPTPQGGTAFEAWQNNVKSGKAYEGTRGMQAGDQVFFSPNHTGIYMGNGRFISSTDNGVQVDSLSEWEKSTGQSVLGYVK